LLAGMRGAFITGLLALALAGGACQSDEEATPSTSPTPTVTGKGPRSPTPTDGAESTPTPARTPNSDPILRLVDEVLFRDLNLRITVAREQIEVVMVEEHEWPDRCLGLVPPESCLLPIEPVSGYRITLRANAEDYIYHTSREGGYLFAGTPGGLNTVLERAKYYLVHEAGIDAGQIEVARVEEIIWQSACMGLPSGDGQCPPTGAGPGYRITLRAGGQDYLFHADRMGSAKRVHNTPD